MVKLWTEDNAEEANKEGDIAEKTKKKKKTKNTDG